MDLITDRTQDDVLSGNEKGYYSYSDLNRVESAVSELAIIAKEIGVKKEFETKTDWGIPGVFSDSQWPTKQQMQRYISNIRELCGAVEAAANLPSSMDKLTWDGANQIELALFVAFDRIPRIVQALKYSGEIFSEEESGL